ncbi:HAD-IIIA family hydrolase [Idiomarina xiamenensis]|uniref:Phosphatase n=1 Tax=Idiomarina xiamenensis 10-D-4 TaxID=740709 RepID=K2KG05_9GAMM|nr:HAD-IIIA family hydrolase [Idiomarina xiamenensis]EKE86943.1 phosphatase [Idiomarina xiamenensis 10-D-4]
MKYDLIIFDWDGTLMNSVARIVSAMQNTAQQLQLPIPSTVAVRDIIGLSLAPAYERLFGQQAAPLYDQFLVHYRDEYVDNNVTPSPLFDDTLLTLQQLQQRGHQLAVATGKARRGLDRVWQETAIGHLFVSSRCADESQSKPHPQMLHDILQETGVEAQRAVMVGDSIYDMQMAANAGMDCIGVSFGVHDKARLSEHQPIAVLDRLSDILEITQGSESRRS